MKQVQRVPNSMCINLSIMSPKTHNPQPKKRIQSWTHIINGTKSQRYQLRMAHLKPKETDPALTVGDCTGCWAESVESGKSRNALERCREVCWKSK